MNGHVLCGAWRPISCRCMTGENWNGLMRDCMIQPPFCTKNVDCGSIGEAVFYFVSFELLTYFMFLNVVVGIVLQHFEREFEAEDEDSAVWGGTRVHTPSHPTSACVSLICTAHETEPCHSFLVCVMF